MTSDRKWRIAAFAWGFAEATLFFTVPDVLLTLAAIRLGWRRALWLGLFVLSGALLGGAAMYALASVQPEAARATVASVPLISSQMIDAARDAMRGDWLWSMLIGAMTGTPYKVFATQAPVAGVPLTTFLVGSILARSVRWVLTIAFAAMVAGLLRRYGWDRAVLPLWTVMWLAFYAFYYIIMA